jgi:hypothetical protein
VTSVERTAYRVFPRLMMTRELYLFYSPSQEELAWAREKTDTDEHLLALTLALKCFQRLGRFAKAREVPPVVVEHVRRCLELGEDVAPVYASPRTAESHRVLVRRREGVAYAPGKARKIAAKAMTRAAWVKNHPPDLINVALERLAQARLELPAFSTLDSMESTIRGQVNGQIFQTIWRSLGAVDRARIEALLVVGPGGKSDLDRLKKPARRASWSKFKAQAARLAWVEDLCDTEMVLEGIAASKIADFAGVADAADADVLGRTYTVDAKRVALLVCLVHTAQARARDDLAEMLCKRMAATAKKAKAKLEEIHQRQRQVVENLILTYRGVLQGLVPGGPVEAAEAAAAQMVMMALAALTGSDGDADTDTEATTGAGGDAGREAGGDTEEPDQRAGLGAAVEVLVKAVRMQAAGMGSVRQVVERAGGAAAQLADIEEVTAYQHDNHELLIQQFFKADRSTMLALAAVLRFKATSADRSVLEALEHALVYWGKTRDFIPARGEDDRRLDLGFASANWLRAIRDRKHPGMLVKRHFEAMVFAYLAEELRTGDIAVAGAAEYGDWSSHLLTFDQCRPLLATYCAEAGLPASAAEFVAELKEHHRQAAEHLDAGYADNEDLMFAKDGTPTLKRLAGLGTTATATKLGAEIKARMPERTLIQITSRTAYWLGWHRHFGPASGHDAKLKKPQDRYVLTTFACGSNMGPAEAAPAHRGDHRARDIPGQEPAHQPGQAEQGDHRCGQRLRPAGRGQGLGRWQQRGHRRHPGRHLHRQPARRVLDPLRRIRRDRLPLRLRQLHRPVLPIRSLRGVGGDLHHRRAAGQRLRSPAQDRARRYPGPVLPRLHPRAFVRLRRSSRPSRLAPDPHINDAPGTYRRASQPITTSSPVPTPIPASPSRIHRGVMSSSKRCRSTMRPVRASSLTSVVASSAT